MPTTRRTRTVPAAPEAVWRIVGDPNHLPRWWPKVERVERVEGAGFTKVFVTKKGRPVRADFSVVEHAAPNERRWAQQIEDTPFERILLSSEEVARVARTDDGGTRVTLEMRQRLRGMGKLGGFLVKRATRRQLDEALDGLSRLL